MNNNVKAGNRIRIINAKLHGDKYGNGDEFIVQDVWISGVGVSTTEGLPIYAEEFEVIDAEITQADSVADIYPKYYKDVRGIDFIDVYKTHELFGIDDPSGAIHHASKKLLLSGARTGGKSKYNDVREARDTLTRWLSMHAEIDEECR